MASPIVAAVAALAWSANPGESNSAVRAKVEASTNTIEGIGTFWSHGRVNADLAVHW
jgi:thermitase